MKVKLLKPVKIGTIEKPKDKVLDVTRTFGQQLIDGGSAEVYVPPKKKAGIFKKKEPSKP